ncbi:hypothetical protein IFM89_026664 [Coptis chinensis]|uniref:Pentatricopeptide repeat-containing protein n=1 Tax=Coptis chinensis TaxID=261450 RepID=A0A835MJ99_9MAGN|nr:hypothetical protein IFM89_026664 [Coptis chinensis]
MGFDSDVFVAGGTIDMYSKSGNLDIARRVFDRMGKRDIVVWNSMITGYTQNNYVWEVIELFQQLQLEDGFSPNATTFCCVLKASSLMEDSVLGKCFHAKALMSGSSLDVFVGTAVVDMYSKYFDMEDAERAFQDMPSMNLVSFNALITGYSLSGQYVESMQTYINLLFEKLRPDSFTFVGLLSSCSVLGALREGAHVHACALKIGLDSETIVGNSLVNLMDWEIWHLSVFVNYISRPQKPDEFSFTSVLKALANGAAVLQGRHVHAHVIKMGLEFTVYVGSALIDMYAKCGMIEDSFQVFSKMPEKNVVSWNSMMIAYAQSGYSNKALHLFQEMMSSGVIPTSITFTGILLACSRTGLVGEGKQYYESMVSYYKIPPSVEHCTCMVDLLGRSGYIDDAETFLLRSPFPSEPGLWRSLLTACGVHKNMDVAVRVAENFLRLEPHDSAILGRAALQRFPVLTINLCILENVFDQNFCEDDQVSKKVLELSAGERCVSWFIQKMTSVMAKKMTDREHTARYNWIYLFVMKLLEFSRFSCELSGSASPAVWENLPGHCLGGGGGEVIGRCGRWCCRRWRWKVEGGVASWWVEDCIGEMGLVVMMVLFGAGEAQGCRGVSAIRNWKKPGDLKPGGSVEKSGAVVDVEISKPDFQVAHCKSIYTGLCLKNNDDYKPDTDW